VKTSVEKITPTRATITMTADSDDLKPHMDAAYKEIAGQVQIPGFRRGKVPAAIIDQRFGREVVLEQAIQNSLDGFYQQALNEHELMPLSRPEADVVEQPNPQSMSGNLVVTVTVDIRPEIDLPDYTNLKIEVDPIQTSDDEVDAELDELRARFGTLRTIDRPIEDGDFVTIDLTAEIDGEKVDEANGISYELGSGQLLEGIDDALLTLTADEETTFTSTLLGGEHEGKDAEVTVKVLAVKERELPEADDDFAQMASEFDTIEELREDLGRQAARKGRIAQLEQARDRALAQLVEAANVPVPEQMIEDEVTNHLQQENRVDDTEHEAEVRETAQNSFRQQVVLDKIIAEEKIEIGEEEFTQFLVQNAAQYGMAPQDFVNALQDANQLAGMLAEMARSKAILLVLDTATVTDTDGTEVDLSEYTAAARQAPAADEAEAPTDAESDAADEVDDTANEEETVSE